MRLSEILDKNQLVIILRGFDTEFDETYSLILNAYRLFNKTKHVSKLTMLKQQIDKFCNELTEFIDYDWPDKTDSDIIVLIKKADQIRSSLIMLTF